MMLFRMLLIALALALPFSAYASGSYDLEFTAKERYEDVKVGWIVTDDVVQTCNMAMALAGAKVRYNSKLVACAVVYRVSNSCVIYTAKQLSLAVLGHEIRHCFEGAWHD
jgi:hypothetical protein